MAKKEILYVGNNANANEQLKESFVLCELNTERVNSWKYDHQPKDKMAIVIETTDAVADTEKIEQAIDYACCFCLPLFVKYSSLTDNLKRSLEDYSCRTSITIVFDGTPDADLLLVDEINKANRHPGYQSL